MRSFRSILWKEWVSLRPFALLLFALFVFGLFMVQASEYFDDLPIWENFLSETTPVGLETFILCVVVSMGLVVREKDEGTLLYLDGLPLSRFSVYLAKWICAVVLILALNLLWTLEAIVYELLSRGSASPPTPWRSIGVFTVLESFLSAYFITILIAFSFLRRWALIAIGGIFWIIFWLKSMQVPYAELLDPFTLIEPPAEIDERWEWPRLQLIVMTVMAAIAWIAGYFIFSLRQGASNAFTCGMKEAWWGKLAWFCAIVLVIGIFVATSWDEGVKAAAEEAEKAKSRPSPLEGNEEVVTTGSGRFLFIYRDKDRRRMKTLVENADPVFETVADFLEVPETTRNERITVNLSSPLASHSAGQAYWKKIRMALPENPKEAEGETKGEREAIAILGHELTHVFIDQITQGRLRDSFDSARWFHEGLASYVEFRFFHDDTEATPYRRWVALASRWNEVEFAEMVENSVFSSLRDPSLAYPAGYLWVDSLVRVYGDEAPAKLLGAIGREDGPWLLEGLALWRDACLAAGYDLERVLSDFRTQLKILRTEFDGELAAFPEITSGSAVRRGEKIIIQPQLPEGWNKTLPENASLVCRVRPRPNAASTQWRYSKLGDDNTFAVPSLNFLKAGIGFQVGWVLGDESTQPVFGQWVNVTLSNEDDK